MRDCAANLLRVGGDGGDEGRWPPLVNPRQLLCQYAREGLAAEALLELVADAEKARRAGHTQQRLKICHAEHAEHRTQRQPALACGAQ